MFNDENIESEKPEPVVAVFCAFKNGNVGGPLLSSGFPSMNENDDATLVISPFPSPPLPEAPSPFVHPNDSVCCRCCGCWGCAPFTPVCCPFTLLLVLLPPMVNSDSVGALGTGGTGTIGIPNGFLEPV